ncbi:hypothetical protein Verru16b_00302 [Lacunisphaera limnophila]|uniref:DUF3108 domain-containing protein n=1 Tax=Lacunisphaera limnophila TaxID=1838286 RepID=A0A1I7PI07_9BACT|nr:hypothetical protein [Lacunisphaera limnophila]AOS43259.1 hypothetical protein Verru16b_00302 [Lacunisphaera limnophila]
MKNTFRVLLALLCALPAAAALKEAALRLPDALATAPRLPVQGRQGWKLLERLEFGGLTVHDVQRSLSKGGDLAIAIPGLGYEGSKRRQTFLFKVDGPDLPAWRGAAATNLRRRALDVGVDLELHNKSGFMALLSPDAQADVQWTLDLQEKGERPLVGTLSRDDVIVTVTGTNKLAGTILPLGETTGYIFEVKGRPLAAVEVINHGAVWFAPDLDPALRAPVTTAISSLLLFEELRQTLPE